MCAFYFSEYPNFHPQFKNITHTHKPNSIKVKENCVFFKAVHLFLYENKTIFQMNTNTAEALVLKFVPVCLTSRPLCDHNGLSD